MKNGIPSDFPVDVDRFLMSETVGCMEAEQVGAYWLLLLYAWSQPDCTIPADDARLAKLSRLEKRWAKVGQLVRSCFEPVPDRPDRMWNRLQVQTREEQKARMEKSAEKCEKMRQAKANKQDNQMKFEDLQKAHSKANSEASYKEPAKGSVEASSKESLEEPLQALSVPYSSSLPIPKGGGSPKTEDVQGHAVGVPPLSASPQKNGGRAPFRPEPRPLSDRLFRRELEGMEADAKAMIERIQTDPLNCDRVLKTDVAQVIASLEAREPEGWERRVAELRSMESSYTTRPKPEVAALVGRWRARIDELKLAKAGARPGAAVAA